MTKMWDPRCTSNSKTASWPTPIDASGAVTSNLLALGVHQLKGLNIVDDGLKIHAAAVHIRRQCAAERQTIGTGLFLKYAELRFGPYLPFREPTQQLGPFDARLRFDGLARLIETDTRFIPRVSSNNMPVPNCCPPMEWRLPETLTARPSRRA